ncbi:hypothetical protein Peur_040942 [Populus x canadensis]
MFMHGGTGLLAASRPPFQAPPPPPRVPQSPRSTWPYVRNLAHMIALIITS